MPVETQRTIGSTEEKVRILAFLERELRNRGKVLPSDETVAGLILKFYIGRTQMRPKSRPPLMIEVCREIDNLRLSDPARFTTFEEIKPIILEMTPVEITIDPPASAMVVHSELSPSEATGGLERFNWGR